MPEKSKKSNAIITIIAGLIVAFLIGHLIDSREDNSTSENKVDALTELTSATPSNLSPTGQLKEMFQVPSDYTDLQRKDMLNQIKGKIVVWRLPVWEIRQVKGNKYEVTTHGDGKAVACEIYITVDSSEEKQALLRLKTGDFISFKGVLTGKTSLRSLVIEPAIIWDKSVASVINNRAMMNIIVRPFDCSYEDGTMWVHALMGDGEHDEIIFYNKTKKNTCNQLMKMKKARIYYNELDNDAPDCPMAHLIKFEAVN